MPRRPKRFYKRAEAVPTDGGYRILLDGKPVRTPARRELLLPHRRLAEAVAEEWRGQGDEIAVETMPLTRLAFTSVDRVAPNRAATIEQIAAYGASDLLCYRAATPTDLSLRQKRSWDPLLAWAGESLGVVLTTGEGLAHIAQPEGSMRLLRQVLGRYDDFTLTTVHLAATLTGSVVIALALAEGAMDAKAAFAAARLDETYQAERWGEIEEAKHAAEAKAAELEISERALQLTRE